MEISVLGTDYISTDLLKVVEMKKRGQKQSESFTSGFCYDLKQIERWIEAVAQIKLRAMQRVARDDLIQITLAMILRFHRVSCCTLLVVGQDFH